MASDNPNESRKCFGVTLEKWLKMNVEVTWGNLELAITNANRQNLDLQPLTAGKECLIIATSLGAVPVVGISKKAW